MQKDIRRRHEANRRAHAICEQNRGVIETNDGGKKALSRFTTTVDGVDVLLADPIRGRRLSSARWPACRRRRGSCRGPA